MAAARRTRSESVISERSVVMLSVLPGPQAPATTDWDITPWTTAAQQGASARGPAGVHHERSAGEGRSRRSQQEPDGGRDLLGLDQPLEHVGGEDDLVEHLSLRHAV